MADGENNDKSASDIANEHAGAVRAELKRVYELDIGVDVPREIVEAFAIKKQTLLQISDIEPIFRLIKRLNDIKFLSLNHEDMALIIRVIQTPDSSFREMLIRNVIGEQ